MQILFHGVGHYAPSQTLGPALWPHADVIVGMEGQFMLTVEDQPFTLSAGDALAIPAGHRFHGSCLSDGGVIWVLHYAGFPARDGSPFAEGTTPRLLPRVTGTRLDRTLLERFSECHRQAPDQKEALLLAELLLTRIENSTFAPAHAEPEHLRQAVEAATRGRLPGGINGSVAEMARVAGLGPSRFRQVFAEHYGISPVRYLQQLRMETARRLLGETQRPIKEIAQLTGFTELAAFHRAFRREIGATPAAYRRARSVL